MVLATDETVETENRDSPPPPLFFSCVPSNEPSSHRFMLKKYHQPPRTEYPLGDLLRPASGGSLPGGAGERPPPACCRRPASAVQRRLWVRWGQRGSGRPRRGRRGRYAGRTSGRITGVGMAEGGMGDNPGSSDKAASSPGASVDEQVGLVCAHARASCMLALRMAAVARAVCSTCCAERSGVHAYAHAHAGYRAAERTAPGCLHAERLCVCRRCPLPAPLVPALHNRAPGAMAPHTTTKARLQTPYSDWRGRKC